MRSFVSSTSAPTSSPPAHRSAPRRPSSTSRCAPWRSTASRSMRLRGTTRTTRAGPLLSDVTSTRPRANCPVARTSSRSRLARRRRQRLARLHAFDNRGSHVVPDVALEHDRHPRETAPLPSFEIGHGADRGHLPEDRCTRRRWDGDDRRPGLRCACESVLTARRDRRQARKSRRRRDQRGQEKRRASHSDDCYSNSSLQRRSPPRLPRAEDETSVTLS